MLRLEKLELRGFKSFCEPSEIDLRETVTAIVGPNGCGKSNIVDSITWVLGEQSARLLRGSKMEDVIFQGSRTRQPQGFAEVTLHLVANKAFSTQNGDRQPDAETEASANPAESSGFNFSVAAGDRITLGRRLYRSGESEYRLNGRRVRLRDIHDLFAGTGLGPGHYAIIGQGQVEGLLTAKPHERRAVIEAAAGIGRFRLRQRTIELRLQAATQNLARINDVLFELERQVRSLKRQAAKARRYRRLKEEWRGLLRVLFAAEHRRIQQELEELHQRIALVTNTHAQLKSDVAELESQYRQAMDEGRRWESTLSHCRDQLNSVELQLERTRSQRSSCQEQIANHRARQEDLQRDAARLGQRLEVVEQEAQRCSMKLADLATIVQSDYELLAEREALYRAEGARVKAVEQQLEALQQQRLEETNNNANLRHAAQQVEIDLERVENQLKGLQAERQRALAKRADLEAQQAELSQAVMRDREQVQRLKEQIARLEEELTQARSTESAQARDVASLEREQLAVDERLSVLVELERQHAYCSPAVQRLFEEGSRENHVHLLGTLADRLSVHRQHERMVESVLGERLQTILVPTIEQATEAIQFLKRTRSGEATFLVVGEPDAHETAKSGPPPHAAHDQEAGSASSQQSRPFLSVLGLEQGIAEAFTRAFPEIAAAPVTADLNTAVELSRRDEARMFVTLDGDRVRAGRLIAGGGQQEDVKSVLAIKREIQELRQRDAQLHLAIEKARRRLAKAEDRIAALARDLAGQRAGQQREEKALMEREMQLSALDNELARAEQHVRVVDAELTQVEQDRQELVARRDRLTDARQKAEQRLSQLQAKTQAAQADLQTIRDAVDRRSESLSATRAQVAATEERKRGLEADLKRLQKEKQSIDSQRQTNAWEMNRIEEETGQLQTSLVAIDDALEQLQAERVEVEARVRQAVEQVEQLHGRIDDINTKLDDRRTQERERREELAGLEIERTQLVSDARHLAETCKNELIQSLDEVLAMVAGGESLVAAQVDVDDVEAVKQRVQTVRRKLDEIGPVNMMALDELEAQQERLEFLQDQRQDVLESITSTEKALAEVKRRSRRRFITAFDAINANFSQVFQELFGGGQGRMVLLDEANPLESGVDIVAQPPGKRLQNIMLLSGGEKSMTALALLLAIFRYRPSPFCVLDEVDAQLDDVNVRRFVRQIEQMSQQTQFIIITHNKATMHVAGALHGVTMEEPGVSKLVSVRLK